MSCESRDLLKVSRDILLSEHLTATHVARAISTTYYAIFHHAVCACQNILLPEDLGLNRARNHLARSILHKELKTRCKSCASNPEFPDVITAFAEAFGQLQIARHKADYDNHTRFTVEEARAYLVSAESAMNGLDSAEEKHLRAFVTWLIFEKRDWDDT